MKRIKAAFLVMVLLQAVHSVEDAETVTLFVSSLENFNVF